jgi:hypothetical protein
MLLCYDYDTTTTKEGMVMVVVWVVSAFAVRFLGHSDK